MAKVQLILVGGFLGAGKTTLLGKAAARYSAAGRTVGLITNDQAEDLVDTQVLRARGFRVQEVGGGCFCCRFADLVGATDKLIAEHRPDVLIGEPVGSCTDLAATVLRPLQRFYPGRYAIAPFSVVVDPERLEDLLSSKAASPLAEKVLYIYGKQLEEADVILLNKTDAISPERAQALAATLAMRFPAAKVMAISALEDRGVDEWLAYLQRSAAGGARVMEVDYGTYAEGEALLGWLNASVRVKARAAQDWKALGLKLLQELRARFAASKAEVAHVKLALTAEGTALTGSLTSTRGHPFLIVQGEAGAPSSEALLLLNARVQSEPETLKQTVHAALAAWAGEALELEVAALRHFAPAPPQPTHRFAEPETCTVEGNPCATIRDLFRPKRKQDRRA